MYDYKSEKVDGSNVRISISILLRRQGDEGKGLKRKVKKAVRSYGVKLHNRSSWEYYYCIM